MHKVLKDPDLLFQCINVTHFLKLAKILYNFSFIKETSFIRINLNFIINSILIFFSRLMVRKYWLVEEVLMLPHHQTPRKIRYFSNLCVWCHQTVAHYSFIIFMILFALEFIFNSCNMLISISQSKFTWLGTWRLVFGEFFY